ncbi:MAG: hypothetical protein JNJ88_12635 [Planctomycetes bacterium]|nr:hypothetical protein [Planctomycetota bacterium]
MSIRAKSVFHGVAELAAAALWGAGLFFLIVISFWGGPAAAFRLLGPYILLLAWPILQRSKAAVRVRTRSVIDVLLCSGAAASVITVACTLLRFPFRRSSSNMHGAGMSGGEENLLLLPWAHIVLFAVGILLLTKIQKPPSGPNLKA